MLKIEEVKKLVKDEIDDKLAERILNDFYILADIIFDHLEDTLRINEKNV